MLGQGFSRPSVRTERSAKEVPVSAEYERHQAVEHPPRQAMPSINKRKNMDKILSQVSSGSLRG
jgi:hypothetical protein